LLAILDAVEAAGAAPALPTQASVDYSRTDQPRGERYRDSAARDRRHNAARPV